MLTARHNDDDDDDDDDYFLFHGSTATWDYSISLFAFKAQII